METDGHGPGLRRAAAGPNMDPGQIDDEIVLLKNELSRTKNALTDQIYKRHRLVGELSARVDRRNGQLTDVHRSNSDELGRVLRSLYVLESRLRKEQQQIRRQLGERDAVIRQQQVEMAKLRQALTLACVCHRNGGKPDEDAAREDAAADVPMPSKPDLITSISPRPSSSSNRRDRDEPAKNDVDSGPTEPAEGYPAALPPPPPPPLLAPKSDPGTRNNGHLLAVDARAKMAPPNSSNALNFNKNVYNSKTVTDLSLNDISSFPNPTPNNNLFVVSNSIFSKNEFTYNKAPKEPITSIKQNGKVITSALKKADKYPSPKSVHFGKTTHIPEPDEEGQTDIVKTVETLLLQCGDSCTESENDTSSTASTETSPSVSQMVRKFERICTTGLVPAANNGMEPGKCGTTGPSADLNGSYIADVELKTAAELDEDVAMAPDRDSMVPSSLGDLDPRNNFEEFRFEDSDLDKEYGSRPEADGLECPGQPVRCPALSAATEDCQENGGGVVTGGATGARVNYESFLEVTGLSQKSIITVQSNRNLYGSHRNVQKPKDVKSRSRAKSASFECNSRPMYSSTIKYWTEPYL